MAFHFIADACHRSGIELPLGDGMLASLPLDGGADMVRAAVAVVLAMMALPLSGCGTFGNVCWLNREEGGQRVYGGVRAEVEILQGSEDTSGSTWVNSDDHRR